MNLKSQGTWPLHSNPDVVPAKAGAHILRAGVFARLAKLRARCSWVRAFAGTTRTSIHDRSRSLRSLVRCAAVAWVALLPALPASSQTPAEFFKGKTIDLYIAYSVGGGYDLYARMVARHLGKHIPGNPVVLPKNMEGAGGLRMANWMYQAAPRDGTAIGAGSGSVCVAPMLGNRAAQYEATKFTWIGSANDEVSVCVSWHTSGVATFEDVLAKELTVGSTGQGDDTYQFPRFVNNVLGTKFKMITGYPGGNDVSLAIERGEVGGRCRSEEH